MNEVEQLMRKGRMVCASLLFLAAIGMLIQHGSILWPGIIVGLSTGYFNVETLFRRVKKSTEDPQGLNGALGMMRTGSGLRFAATAIATVVIIRSHYSVFGFVGGLIAPQAIITLLYASMFNNNRKG
ncbi:MAG TPA: ATP synthase subunit I [Candidatus Deferrimicrobium sp.]|nr:ATP synthase subunit I [Candidatus Deferrimicrobium sp.]